MISTVLTTRSAPAMNTAVLATLADRWRGAGVYLACFAPDGNLVWHDPQMPRAMALCATSNPILARYVRALPDTETPATAALAPIPGIQVHLAPVVRRRRVAAYLAVLARIDDVGASEELHRAAARASLDVPALLAQAQRTPLLPEANLAPLVGLVAHMYDDLQTALNAQHELSSVTEQLSSVYEELSLLYKISSGMRFTQKTHAFLEEVAREVQQIGGFRTVAVAMASRDADSADPVVGEVAVSVGACTLQGAELANALYAPIAESLRTGETCIHNDLSATADNPRLRNVMQRFVCVPLMRDKRPLGVLLAIDKADHTEFTSVDIKLLNNVASQCSIFMENAALYQDMQGLFMGVLHALTRSIDAKDAYTRGHSQRVAELSRALARKIGLPEEQCERVYLSGLLHDVGKIGVPEAVLTKPGRLTDAEFEAIKRHPAIGAQILGSIKQLQDIIPGVLYHHERWDGRGYPYNLAGEGIPLMGRIICVADSFDAMSSTRTYRPALPLDTVLAEIKRCAGTQFDPELARVFITLDFSMYRKALDEQLTTLKLAAAANGGEA